MTTIYTPSGAPATLNRGASSAMRNEFTLIKTGLDAAFPSVENVNRHTDNYAVDTGVANAYLVTLAPAPTSYVDGMEVVFKPINSSTSASTINVNALGLKAIRNFDSSAIVTGDIRVGVPVILRYSTTTGFFHIPYGAQAAVNAAAASASASAASAVASAASAVDSSGFATASSNSATSSSGFATASSNSATASANSAIDAANFAAALLGTSTTSLAIALGSKSFTTQAGKQFAAGEYVLAVSAANTANYMHGQVTSYSGTSLVLDVQSIGGSGTKADWNLSISGVKGAAGPQNTATSIYMYQTFGVF